MSTGTVPAPGSGVGTISIHVKVVSGQVKIQPFDVKNYASVQFSNETLGNVALWIPNGGELFVGADTKGDIFLSIPAGTSQSLPVSISNQHKQIYRYSAYCEAINAYAEGGSAPEIHCS